MIDLVSDKNRCSGCAACLNICPVNAISMTEDEYGFTYPLISSSLCVECGQCVSVCPFKKEKCPESDQETYAAVANNVDLKESSSGGVFPGIAEEFIKVGGIVYGCAMQYETNGLTLRHIRVSDSEDLKKLKGSKYVQSDVGLVYRNVNKDLKERKKVLFTGTPCQVAGLYGFLKRDDPNLYTMDIICHGVPSQKVFHSYIRFEEEARNIQIRNFVFRDKSEGWKLFGRIEGINTKEKEVSVYFNAEDSLYYQLFLDKFIYRDSCYHCPFASKHRPGNITAADYWNIDLAHPELVKENGGPIETKYGVSALVINNKKGKELIGLYGRQLSLWESSYEKASRYNGQFTRPSTEPEKRKQVLDCITNDFVKLEQQYKKKLRKKKIKRTIRRTIPKPVKQAIKIIAKNIGINTK